MTAEQVAAVLGLDEDDGTTRVVIKSPEEAPLEVVVGRPTAPPPAPEFL